MEQPLVSILMTAYNRQKYIAEAIESVLASTYQNWELIIVDDCSKDRTVEIANSYEAKDIRIKVYLNEKNLGDYPNRNKAASYANGKYLKYLDADDLLYPHGLEILIFHMEKFPESAYGLCSLPQDDDRIYPFELSPIEAYYRHYLTGKWIFHKAPLSSIIKKTFFDKINGFTGKPHLGDFELWNLLSQKFNVVLLPGDAVWHRSHEDQQMKIRMKSPVKSISYLLAEYELLNSANCPLLDSDKKKAIKKCLRKQARYIMRHLKTHGIKKAMELKKMSDLSLFDVLIKALIKI